MPGLDTSWFDIKAVTELEKIQPGGGDSALTEILYLFLPLLYYIKCDLFAMSFQKW